MRLLHTVLLLSTAVPAVAQRQIDFMPFELPEDGSIVVPVPGGDKTSDLVAALDTRTGGAIAIAMAEAAFTGEKNQVLTLFGVKPYSRVDLIGVGADAVDRVDGAGTGDYRRGGVGVQARVIRQFLEMNIRLGITGAHVGAQHVVGVVLDVVYQRLDILLR